MKISDVEVGAVYRFTYRGVAASKLNSRGPWLVGAAIATRNGQVSIEPVGGLPVTASQPPAGVALASPAAPMSISVTRIDGRLCHVGEWPRWLHEYTRTERANAEARDATAQANKAATITLVASLFHLGMDVGRGPWDRSTCWGQFVDELRRREPDVLGNTAMAYAALASPDDFDRTAATVWYDSKIS